MGEQPGVLEPRPSSLIPPRVPDHAGDLVAPPIGCEELVGPGEVRGLPLRRDSQRARIAACRPSDLAEPDRSLPVPKAVHDSAGELHVGQDAVRSGGVRMDVDAVEQLLGVLLPVDGREVSLERDPDDVAVAGRARKEPGEQDARGRIAL